MNKKIDLKELTLKNLIERSVKEYANDNSLGVVGKGIIPYKVLGEKVQEMQKTLKGYGIKKGDKVALYSESMPNWGISYLAITSMGAIVVPILVDFHPNEVRHIIHQAECKAAIVSQKYIDTIYEDENSKLKFVITINTLEIVQDLSTEKNKKKEFTEEEVYEDDLASIIYTSGTTGHSKGVMLTHKNIVSNVIAAQYVMTVKKEDILLSMLPLPHVLECTVGFLIPVFNGASIYYMEKPPTPRILLGALETVRPTFIVTVPLIIEKIYKNRILPKFTKNRAMAKLYEIPFVRKRLHKIAGKKLIETFGGRLRFFGIGGAKISAQVESFLDEANFPFTIGYGLTETAPLVAGTSPDKRKRRSTGPSIEGVEIKLAQDGEILVKGPNVMKGYYKDTERTEEVFQDGWFCTGDLGRIDSDGYLFIEGRSKNVIIGPSGENIYPEQIESLINDYKFIADSVVYEENNQLVARINLEYELIDTAFNAENSADSEMEKKILDLLEEIRLDLNKNVSGFSKVTKFIEHPEPFVKTATKKIKRYLYTS